MLRLVTCWLAAAGGDAGRGGLRRSGPGAGGRVLPARRDRALQRVRRQLQLLPDPNGRRVAGRPARAERRRPHFDLALLDTGAGFSALSSSGYDAFNLDGPYPGERDGYAGTEIVPIGGATGQLSAPINDPFGLYVAGLQGSDGGGSGAELGRRVDQRANQHGDDHAAGGIRPGRTSWDFRSRASTRPASAAISRRSSSSGARRSAPLRLSSCRSEAVGETSSGKRR